jgi:Tol biopolymer transport system component
MTKLRHLNLAPYVRLICLLLCCALVAPPVAISAAPGTPLRGWVSDAGGVTHGGLPQGEATMPDGPLAKARVEEKLAATAGPLPLAKSPDERGGNPNRDSANTPTGGKIVARGATAAVPTRVMRVVPAPENAAAAGAAAKPGAETPALRNILGEADSPVFSIASGAATAPLEALAVSEKAAEAAGRSALKGSAKEDAKKNHVSDLVPDAVGSGVPGSPRRDVVSETPKALPETLPSLNRQPSLTKKAEQLKGLDAPAAAGVVVADGGPALLETASAGAGFAAVSADPSASKLPAASVAVLPDAKAETLTAAAEGRAAAELSAPESAPTAAAAPPGADEGAALIDGESMNAAATPAAMLAAAAGPANDTFASAQVISGLPGSTSGSNLGATRETGEPYHAGNKGGASVWYKWQAPSSGSVDFSTSDSTFDTTLAVYKGTSVSALTEVASNDEINPTNSTSRVTFSAVAGTVYYVAVDGFFDGYSTAQGGISLSWSLTAKPVNDNFVSAQLLSATTSGSVTGTTRGATIEWGEPYHAGNDGGASVWYKWQAPSSGSIEFSTAGSDFDTLLGVYKGTSVGALTGVESNDEEDFNSAVHTSRVVFNAVAGTVYYIAVDGFNDGYVGDWGSVKLQWKVGPAAPANNAFSAAQAITGDEVRLTGSNWLATKETGEPSHAGVAGGKSVWYKFTAPGSGKVTFDTLGSSTDTAMAVYTGTGVSALTQVAANDDADPTAGIFTSRVSFEAVTGTTYYIAIDAWYGEAGTVVLRTPRKTGRVAFVSSRDGDDEIFTSNADGSDLRQLTTNAAADTRPDWSPDGGKIVFESNRDGNNELYVMNADGTGLARLTTNTSNDNQPVWSPDGKKIAFTSDRADDAGGYELYVMNADGTNPVRLTYQVGTDSRPEWSADGGSLFFASTYYGNSEVHRLSAVTGDDQWRMVSSAAAETNPTTSPDGTRYAFQSNITGNNEIFVVNPNGSSVNVTNNPASDEAPDWSPDGEQLLFATTRDGNADVYASSIAGAEPSNVTFNLAADNLADWQSVTATPNNLPVVSLTAPADGTTYAAPATIALTATASDAGGQITSVTFYNGSTLIATDTAAPYSFSWGSVGAGTYSLTAVATDNRGATATSAVSRVVVTPSLSVSVVSPTAGTTFDTASKVTINAEAAANTNAISKVEFYYATAATPATKTLIGSDTTAPYSVQWSSPATAGGYVVSAKVTDSALATAASADVSVTLKAKVINPPAAACARTITAKVVAFDQVYTYNRFGAFNPGGMMYALERDVVAIDAASGTASKGLVSGNVQLRPD